MTIDPGKYTAIYGRVWEADSNSPLAGAVISAHGKQTLSNSDGYWRLEFSSGRLFKIKITSPDYTAVYRKIFLNTGEEGVVADAYLTPLDNLTTMIGPGGGIHTNSGGTVEVIIPQGALARVEEIRTTRLSSSKALPGDLNETSNLDYPIGFLFCAEFAPDDLHFNNPVTLRVKNTWGFAPMLLT